MKTIKAGLYYLQNKERGTVGNSALWWKEGDNGYVCDIKDAKTFTAAEAQEVIDNSCKNKFTAWSIEYIEKKIQHHIDVQSLDYKDKNSH